MYNQPQVDIDSFRQSKVFTLVDLLDLTSVTLVSKKLMGFLCFKIKHANKLISYFIK